ncbi:EVE domain-containing protein, partial [Lysobacter sp. 2RAB21]
MHRSRHPGLPLRAVRLTFPRCRPRRIRTEPPRMTARRRYWLMKSEPDAFSIDDLERVRTEPWNGVRNYQARNYMRDGMKAGDGVLFY